MNRLVSLGFISLFGLSSLACGDEKEPSNRSPSAGSGGEGGSGMAGAGGDAMAGAGGDAMAGAGGMDMTATDVVTPTPDPFEGIATCSGCVEVAVPVVDGNSVANEVDQVGFAFYFGGLDLSNAVVTWRVMALENNENLMVAPYAENGPPYPGAYRAQALLSAENFPPGEWVDVAFDLSAHPALAISDAGLDADASSPAPLDAGLDAGPGALVGDAGPVDGGLLVDATAPPAVTDPLAATFELPLNAAFDKSLVSQLALYVGAGPDLEGEATARIAIDSVRFTGVPGQADVTFDNGLEGLQVNQYQVPPGTQGPLFRP